MPKKIIYDRVDGSQYSRTVKTGPAASGFVHLHAFVQPEHLAIMQARQVETGISVNEQIRRAIRMYNTDGLLYKPMYTGWVKP